MRAWSSTLWTWGACCLLAACAPEPGPAPSAATEATPARHAGLLVVHGDGQERRLCVGFDEESLDGYRLVEKSSVQLAAEYVPGMEGYALCQVDGEGCAFPDQRCFCQPQFWNVWVQEEGAWKAAQTSVSALSFQDGDLLALRWGDSSQPPPAVALEDLCPSQGAGESEAEDQP